MHCHSFFDSLANLPWFGVKFSWSLYCCFSDGLFLSTTFPFTCNFSMVVSKMFSERYCSALLFCVITCLTRCCKTSVFLSLLCPGKQIIKLSLSDGAEDLCCCLFSYTVHVLGRKADCLPQCALLPVQTAGSSQREACACFTAYVREVLKMQSVVFLTLYFLLKWLIFR